MPIIYSYAGTDSEIVKFYNRQRSEGLVLAGVGNGNTNAETLTELNKFANRAVVVRSSRVSSGTVSRNVEINDDELGFIASRDLSPQKARILLQVMLSLTGDREIIQSSFNCDTPLTTNYCRSFE